MIKKSTVMLSIAAIIILIPFELLADEINIRMMPNKVNNEISHMRLQAIMSKGDHKQDLLGRQNNMGSVFGDDCNLNIGNSTGNEGLLSKPQSIIITGAVVNKCR